MTCAWLVLSFCFHTFLTFKQFFFNFCLFYYDFLYISSPYQVSDHIEGLNVPGTPLSMQWRFFRQTFLIFFSNPIKKQERLWEMSLLPQVSEHWYISLIFSFSFFLSLLRMFPKPHYMYVCSFCLNAGFLNIVGLDLYPLFTVSLDKCVLTGLLRANKFRFDQTCFQRNLTAWKLSIFQFDCN